MKELTELPKYFAIKRDKNNPLWKKYISWLNNIHKSDFKGDVYLYYGSCCEDRIGGFDCANNIKPVEIITLEQWDSIVNKPKFEVGKWYKITDCLKTYRRCSDSLLKNNCMLYDERIENNFYFKENSSCFITNNRLQLLTDLSEIQQYLPDGHKDKWFTIKDLSEGKCAVINDGTFEDLKRVLKTAFPTDKYNYSAIESTEFKNKIFFQNSRVKTNWWILGSEEKLNLPTQSVKLFIKQLDMEKEFILPEKWCVRLVNQEVVNYVNSKCFGNYFVVNSNWFYHANHTDLVHPTIFKDYTEITLEQFKQYVLKQNGMETQKLTLGQLKDLYHADNCSDWKRIINAYLQNCVHQKDDYLVEISKNDILIAKRKANRKQLNLLTDLGLKFEEECKFKVGDWVTSIDENRTIRIINIIEDYHKEGWLLQSYGNNAGFILNYEQNNVRQATQEEIDYAQIDWNKLRSGSKVMLKGYIPQSDFSKPFNIVMFNVNCYLQEFLLGFNFKHTPEEFYVTLEQNGNITYCLTSVFKTIITKVISY